MVRFVLNGGLVREVACALFRTLVQAGCGDGLASKHLHYPAQSPSQTLSARDDRIPTIISACRSSPGKGESECLTRPGSAFLVGRSEEGPELLASTAAYR